MLNHRLTDFAAILVLFAAVAVTAYFSGRESVFREAVAAKVAVYDNGRYKFTPACPCDKCECKGECCCE